jgi:ankyrin repeat protein
MGREAVARRLEENRRKLEVGELANGVSSPAAGVEQSWELQFCLLIAANHGDTTCIRMLLDGGVVTADCCAKHGRLTAAAVASGSLDTLKLILEEKLDDANNGTVERRTKPLAEAVIQGKIEMVALLLEHGAEQNFKVSVDISGLRDEVTLVSYAAYQDNIDMVKLLLKDDVADDVDDIDDILDDQDDYKYNQPLIFAVRNENLEMIKLLIDAGADVDAEDRDGKRSALGIAVDMESIPMVELLLKNGANAEYPVNSETPRDIAECNGEREILKIMKGYALTPWTLAASTPSDSDPDDEEETSESETETEMDIDDGSSYEDDEDGEEEEDVIEDDSDDSMVEF